MLLDEVLDVVGRGGKCTWDQGDGGCADDIRVGVDLEKEADEAVKGSEEQQNDSP